MRLGAPVFDAGKDPESWVTAHRRVGYSAGWVPLDGNADEASIRAYADAAAKADIVIAEVGAWSNPIGPDETTCEKALDLCCRQLALAERLGARCCVNIAGSRGAQWDGPHPENLSDDTFELIVASVRRIIDAVKPTRTFYTLETMPWIFPDSPDGYLRLIRAIDRKSFAVHLDPVNMINCPGRYYRSGDLLRECFAKLGPYIKSCHAKDILLSGRLTVHLDEKRPGLGAMDYAAYLSELSRLDPDIPLMIEHLPSAEEYVLAARHIRQVAADTGVTIG